MVTRDTSNIEPYMPVLVHSYHSSNPLRRQPNEWNRMQSVDIFFLNVFHASIHVCDASPVTALQKLFNVHIFIRAIFSIGF